MNELTIINQGGKLLADSREVAAIIGKEHKELLRSIRNYSEVLTSAEMLSLDFFVPSDYIDIKREVRPCYLLTKKGCDMVANKMTGEKGIIFTAKYVEQFDKMEHKLKYQLNNKNLSTEMQALLMHDEKIVVIENRVNELEDNIHITRSQQKQIIYFVKEVIIRALGSKYSAAYKEFGKRAFSEFWKSYQNAFNLASYMDTPKKDFQEALNFINNWKPSRELECMIIGANSQMKAES